MTESRLSFIVDYDDPQAGIVRKYQLCYYTQDDTIEMHDIKNRRVFLKRCSYPQVKPSDFHLGATVTIHSRKLLVASYADKATQQIFATQSERGLLVVSPDHIDLVGLLLQQVLDAGLRVCNVNMLVLRKTEAEEFAPGASEGWADRPIVAIEIRGKDLAATWGEAEASGKLQGVVWTSLGPSAAEDAEWFFGDCSPRKERSCASMKNCTLCLVKPHAAGKCGGSIVDDILREGFELSGFKSVVLDKADAADFLEVYKGVVPEYKHLVEQLSSGQAWVLELRAENPVTSLRELCGPHDPDIARVLRPKTLRARYGISRVNNAVHCTDLPEDGVLESDFFFDLLRPSSS